MYKKRSKTEAQELVHMRDNKIIAAVITGTSTRSM